MAKNPFTRKRLEILPHCAVNGVEQGKRFAAGIYERGKNISEAAFDKLLEPEFSHAVRVFEEKPVELAEVKEIPMTPQQKAQLAAEKAKVEAELKLDKK